MKKDFPIRLILYICAHKYRKLVPNNKIICMKNVNYVINGVLGIAVVILFILYFTGNRNTGLTSKTSTTSSEMSMSNMPVAYIDVDTLLLNYFFSIDLSEQIVKKEEDASAYLNQQQRKLQTDYDSFQYRLQNNAFSTQQRVEQEQQRLIRQNQELQETAEKMSMNLLEERERLNMQLRDTIVVHLKEFNQSKHYQIIFSTGSSSIVNPIVFANEVYNITDEVIEFLNKKWAPNKK